MMLVKDTGECFIRSMDEADRDRHVVAYWRFEDRPVGVLLPDTLGNSLPTCATVDSSFNGNDLYVGMARNRPNFSADAPAGVVPQTGSPNRSCLDTSHPTTPINRLNVYTHSQFSHASPLDIQKIAPPQWTIEASVKAAKLFGKAGIPGSGYEFHAASQCGASRAAPGPADLPDQRPRPLRHHFLRRRGPLPRGGCRRLAGQGGAMVSPGGHQRRPRAAALRR